MNIFLGMKISWYIWGHHKIEYIQGSYECILGCFLTVNVQKGVWVAKMSNMILGCLKFLWGFFFFWGGGGWTVDAGLNGNTIQVWALRRKRIVVQNIHIKIQILIHLKKDICSISSVNVYNANDALIWQTASRL